MSKYLININNFQGPLDLLLHLIKEKNLDIFTVDVSSITTQYLDYLNKMETLNLDIASEYLTMAAYLLELKSRRLLQQTNLEEENSDYEADNRQELIQKLLEYQTIKETTSFFKEQEIVRQQVFTRPAIVSNSQQYASLAKKTNWDFNLEQLSFQLQEVYKRYQLNMPMTTRVAKQQISPQKRASEIFNFLKQNPQKSYNLYDIFVESDNITNNLLVVSFSAILDLVRSQQIYIEQADMFAPITLKYRGEFSEESE
ncbi:segregation and condensation protein A [Spiroplasma endosymbiont of Asaphidion curtum]|uniref:segregation and condensation protein A n=1 Tax=Spiroplasma endosymbiont of Asaphidion curtum TaxID=3066281 RepID=UPI00313E8826